MRNVLLAMMLLLAVFVASDAPAGCYECSGDEEGYAICDYQEEVNAGLWADCRGGRICWFMPGGGEYCQPNCGEMRCYLI